MQVVQTLHGREREEANWRKAPAAAAERVAPECDGTCPSLSSPSVLHRTRDSQRVVQSAASAASCLDRAGNSRGPASSADSLLPLDITMALARRHVSRQRPATRSNPPLSRPSRVFEVGIVCLSVLPRCDARLGRDPHSTLSLSNPHPHTLSLPHSSFPSPPQPCHRLASASLPLPPLHLLDLAGAVYGVVAPRGSNLSFTLHPASPQHCWSFVCLASIRPSLSPSTTHSPVSP